MSTLSISRNGTNTPVPLGNYAASLISEVHDRNGTGINHKQTTIQITTNHTLGSLSNGLATMFGVTGKVIDLVITPQ